MGDRNSSGGAYGFVGLGAMGSPMVAKALAAESCRAGALDPMRIVLVKAKLCS